MREPRTSAAAAALAPRAVRATLRYARSPQLADEYKRTVNLALDCLGKGGIVIVDLLAAGVRLRQLGGRRRIEIAERVSNDPTFDATFAIAHELGHWAWRDLLQLDVDCVFEEYFANVFAGTLLGRRAKDFDSSALPPVEWEGNA